MISLRLTCDGKGFIWYLIATVAEIAPLVSPINSLILLSLILNRFPVGVYILESKW